MITIRKYGDLVRYITIKRFLGRSLFNANSYSLEGCMFDTGINMGDELASVSPPISNIFISHTHHDHVGNNASIQKAYGSTIYCHPGSVGKIRHPDNSSFIECFFAGKVWPSVPLEYPDKIELDGAKIVPLHTPGHSDDHSCYYLPERRYLFSGDLVLWGRTKWVSDEVNIYRAIESLEKIGKLDIDVLFPGHGRPFEDPPKIIEEKTEHLKELGVSVLELNEKGLSRKEIRDRVLGKEESMAFLTRGRFSKLNLVDSYLDHKA